MACENVAVTKYRDMYMRTEEVDGLDFSQPQQPAHLLEKIEDLCKEKSYEPLLSRDFVPVKSSDGAAQRDVRIMQWNILAQALSSGADNFVRCPYEALEWDARRVRIVEEILRVQPDVLCLQEVDHYGFLSQVLEAVGYKGCFYPKVDSPALYVLDTNGPDGCAMFYMTSQLELTDQELIVLQSNGQKDNQVCIVSSFKTLKSGKEFSVATTHLKAKRGWEEKRYHQGSWLLKQLEQKYADKTLFFTGDFNGEHTEKVYKACKQSKLGIGSTYALLSDCKEEEPPYTTFKIRGGKEGDEVVSCRTIDYMWYTRANVEPLAVLSIPTADEIGPDRLPCFQYPSDHFSLAADYKLK